MAGLTINLKQIFSRDIQIGDEVKVISNTGGHGYTIGRNYKISFKNGNNYQLENAGEGVYSVYDQDLESLKSFDIGTIKKEFHRANSIIQTLDNDEEFDASSIEKKIISIIILEELKNTDDDMSKMDIIEKYLAK